VDSLTVELIFNTRVNNAPLDPRKNLLVKATVQDPTSCEDGSGGCEPA
jgi:hypothetical protein